MRLTDLPALSVLTRRIDADRSRAVDALLESFDRQGEAARSAIDAAPRRAGAEADIDGCARELLAAYRELPAASLGALDGASRLADRAFRSNREEILDGPNVPTMLRHAAMLGLEFVHRRVGSYELWKRALVRRVADLPSAHLYELAAGTGGFSRWLATQNLPFQLTCSDRETGYVVVGATLAERKRLSLKFEPRNITALAHLKGVDLFFTSQAVHHLTPGLVVTMMREAARTASRGLVLVDLLRSPANALGTVAGIAATLPLPVLLADGLQSVRRAYTLGELSLLARFAGVANIEAETLGPVHGIVHLEGLRA